MTSLGLKLEMYMRYVDDADLTARGAPLGTRLEEGRLVVREEEVEEDRKVPSDRRMAT